MWALPPLVTKDFSAITLSASYQSLFPLRLFSSPCSVEQLNSLGPSVHLFARGVQQCLKTFPYVRNGVHGVNNNRSSRTVIQLKTEPSKTNLSLYVPCPQMRAPWALYRAPHLACERTFPSIYFWSLGGACCLCLAGQREVVCWCVAASDLKRVRAVRSSLERK